MLRISLGMLSPLEPGVELPTMELMTLSIDILPVVFRMNRF